MDKINQLDNPTVIFDLVNNDNKKITIAAIYAPSDSDDPYYFENVDNVLQERVEDSDYQIIIGD